MYRTHHKWYNMQPIVITLPEFFDNEAEVITAKFQAGLQRLHLRKPSATEAELRRLLSAIPAVYHPRIVLHDHFSLVKDFAVGGVHLNRRNALMPYGWKGSVSVSCHTINELQVRKQQGASDSKGCQRAFDYLTLSPVFDSISKSGYNAAFTDEELNNAHKSGIIDNRVYALGGITRSNIYKVAEMGFGCAMMLGDAWQSVTRRGDRNYLPVTLTIAGSDTSAGAGIQQDMKTMTHLGCYAATVITALTSQNTMGVHDVMPVPPEVVESQLRAVFSDMCVEAVKIGMIPDATVAAVIARVLREELRHYPIPVVLDPIMISTSGRRLMNEDCIKVLEDELFPLCTLVTPNLPEHQYLTQHNINVPTNTLVKGGHAAGSEMTDCLFLRDENRHEYFTEPRIESGNLHGTGCTLSSAICAYLAHGCSLVSAVRLAKKQLTQAIINGADVHVGKGNGPLIFWS